MLRCESDHASLSGGCRNDPANVLARRIYLRRVFQAIQAVPGIYCTIIWCLVQPYSIVVLKHLLSPRQGSGLFFGIFPPIEAQMFQVYLTPHTNTESITIPTLNQVRTMPCTEIKSTSTIHSTTFWNSIPHTKIKLISTKQRNPVNFDPHLNRSQSWCLDTKAKWTSIKILKQSNARLPQETSQLRSLNWN